MNSFVMAPPNLALENVDIMRRLEGALHPRTGGS